MINGSESYEALTIVQDEFFQKKCVSEYALAGASKSTHTFDLDTSF